MAKVEKNEKYETVSEARELAESIIDTVREPLIVLDSDLRIEMASRSFYQYFAVEPGETVKQFIYDLGNHQWDIPKLRKLLEDILPHSSSFDNFEVEHEFLKIGKRIMLLNARRIPPPPEKIQKILLAFEDITERRRIEEELLKYSQHLEEIVAERTVKVREEADELVKSNRFMVGRELKMIELKNEVNAFLKELGRGPKY